MKSVNYKLSTLAYLELGKTNDLIFFPFTLSFPLLPTFPLLPEFLIFWVIQSLSPARPHGRWRASTPTHGRISVRAYITPVRVLLFWSFSPLPLVGVVGFAWQRPFRLAKGEGVTSILRGIPLRFL
jgi:hypothetical protein